MTKYLVAVRRNHRRSIKRSNVGYLTGTSYLVLGVPCTLGSKFVATKFDTIEQAYNGACALQDCPIFSRPIYEYQYHIEDLEGNVHE